MPDTQDELSAIEYQLAAAWVARDPSFHAKTLADDWMCIDPKGRLLTKSQVLAESFLPELVVTKGEIDDIQVSDYGDWAIVRFRTRAVIQHDEQDIEFSLRFTDVFTRRDGSWQCVSSQGTLLPG